MRVGWEPWRAVISEIEPTVWTEANTVPGRRGENTGSGQTEAKVKASPLQAGTPHFLRGVAAHWLEENAHS